MKSWTQKNKKVLIAGSVGGLILVALLASSSSGEPPEYCGSGYHMENGMCVPDITPTNCPSGYALLNSICTPILPAQDSAISLATTIRTVDKSVGDADYNVWVYVPRGFTGSFTIHLRVINTMTNTEVAHDEKTRSFSNAGDIGYTNNYFHVNGLTGCTKYNVFAYVTSTDGTSAYSGIVTTSTTTRGCPLSLASILDDIRFSLFNWL